jgi:hypothetical protein
LRIGYRTGCRFSRNRDRAVEQGGDGCQRTIRYLQFANAVIRVAGGLRKGCNVGLQSVGNSQAGGVVRACIDARTGGELEEGFLQVGVRDG